MRGTGKTFLINLILSKVRSQRKIALATALSGIASTLLISGRTLHSRCKIPLNIKEDSICYFTRRDATGQLMQKASLLVIDEMSMGHKYVFECLDRSLQYVRKSDKLFGGLYVLLAGDWRQILPVVRHGSREQIVSATLKNSYIWSAVKTFTLTKNMRVAMLDRDAVEFATFLERVGSGKLQIHPNEGNFKVQLPEQYFLYKNSLGGLCDFVFENLQGNFMDSSWLATRAVKAPTNETVDEVNDYMMTKFPGEPRVYKSCDTIEENPHR